MNLEEQFFNLTIKGERGRLYLKDVDIENEQIASWLSGERSIAYEVGELLKEFNFSQYSRREFVDLFRQALQEDKDLHPITYFDTLSIDSRILSMKLFIRSYNPLKEIRARTASYTPIPSWLVRVLLNDPNIAVQAHAAANLAIDPISLQRWLKSANQEALGLYAQTTKNQVWIKEVCCSASISPTVLLSLTENPNVEIGELEKLVDIGTIFNAFSVATHPNANEQLMEKILERFLPQDKNDELAEMAASSEILPAKYQVDFARNKSLYVRRELATRPRLTYEAAEILASDEESDIVRENLRSNYSVTTDYLYKFATHPKKLVRDMAISHVNSYPTLRTIKEAYEQREKKEKTNDIAL